MAQVTCMKRGNYWQYRFEGAKIGGKRKRFTKGGFATKKEAMQAGTKALAEYNNSGLAFIPSEISFSDYLDFWMKEYCKINLKEDTCAGYQKRIKNHIRPALGHYKLKSLSPAVIQSFLNDKFNAGYSRNSLIALKSILSGSLTYTIEPLGFIQTNPASMVKLPSKRATPETPTRKKVREVVPSERWNQIIARFPYGHPCHIPLLLAYRCGLRLGEAFAVTWDDVDFEKEILQITRQVQNIDGFWTFCNPKYDSFREIRLDRFMLETLGKAKTQQDRARLYYDAYYTHLYENEEHRIVTQGDDTSKEIRLINVRENGTYIQPRVMQHCSRVIHYDMGYKSFDFHSLRHTHTTMLLENGAEIKDVQHRLGHKNIQVTLQIYAHLTEKMQNRTVEILNQIPIDDSCTSNLPERGTEAADFTPDFDFVLPCEKSEKSSIYAGFRDNAFQVGVQNCTPDKNLGYKRGTKHNILPLKASFGSKKRATR